MQIGQIKNIRCNEYDNSTWVVFPDDAFTQEQFAEAVARAQRAYESVMAETPLFVQPFGPSGLSLAELRKIPSDKTVGDLLDEYDEKQERRKMHEKLKERKRRSFGYYLQQEGLTPVQSTDADLTTDADWGHKHGELIRYDGLDFLYFISDDDEGNEKCGREDL